MKSKKFVKSGLAVLLIAAFLFIGQASATNGATDSNSGTESITATPTPTPIPEPGIMPLDDLIIEESF